MDSIRQAIVDDLLAAVIATAGINGGVDEWPPENYALPPPQPRPGFGEGRIPFAYVVDGDEQPLDGTMGFYICNLPIQIEIVFPFSRSDAAESCKRRGRAMLADIQKALMLDPNRGGRAQNTVEEFNAVGEAVPEETLGIVVWRGYVVYERSRLDPSSNVGML